MIQCAISDDMISTANERTFGGNHLTFQKGNNVVGFLGEVICEKIIPELCRYNVSDFDYMLDGVKVEVKTKKQTVSCPPKPDWMASVSMKSSHQKPDAYIFCRAYMNKNGVYEHGWVCGWITAERFYKEAVFREAGEPEGDNGYRVRVPSWNLEYYKLNGWK